MKYPFLYLKMNFVLAQATSSVFLSMARNEGHIWQVVDPMVGLGL